MMMMMMMMVVVVVVARKLEVRLQSLRLASYQPTSTSPDARSIVGAIPQSYEADALLHGPMFHRTVKILETLPVLLPSALIRVLIQDSFQLEVTVHYHRHRCHHLVCKKLSFSSLLQLPPYNILFSKATAPKESRHVSSHALQQPETP